MIRTETDAYAAMLARLLIGGFFALSGANNLLDLGGASARAIEAGVPGATLVVLIVAILKMILGLLIIIKHHTKISAITLVVYVVISSLIFYNPLRWDEFPQSEIIFMRNIAILGGLLLLYAHSRGVKLLRGGEVSRLGDRKPPAEHT